MPGGGISRLGLWGLLKYSTVQTQMHDDKYTYLARLYKVPVAEQPLDLVWFAGPWPCDAVISNSLPGDSGATYY